MRKLAMAGSVAAAVLAPQLWPRYTSGQLMSLRPGGQTQTITAGTFAAEHQCAFWDAG
jgi:hypothetical protein